MLDSPMQRLHEDLHSMPEEHLPPTSPVVQPSPWLAVLLQPSLVTAWMHCSCSSCTSLLLLNVFDGTRMHPAVPQAPVRHKAPASVVSPVRSSSAFRSPASTTFRARLILLGFVHPLSRPCKLHSGFRLLHDRGRLAPLGFVQLGRGSGGSRWRKLSRSRKPLRPEALS